MATNKNSNSPASKPEPKKSNSKPETPAKPAQSAPRVPTPMELILAKQAEKKAAKQQGTRPAPSAKTLGTPQGGGAGGHLNTHAKGGASGVARRTAPGG